MKVSATLHTSRGDIRVNLFPDHAPKTVTNFVGLADGTKQYTQRNAKGETSGPFYDGMIFHRVIDGFMVQGGGFEEGMKQKPTDAPIQNEANNGLKNAHYTLAMARTNAPHSATCQFFINTTNNGFLDFKSESPSGWGYAVFGKVVQGMDVVDKIEKVKTSRSGFHDDVPVDAVIIERAVAVE